MEGTELGLWVFSVCHRVGGENKGLGFWLEERAEDRKKGFMVS